LLHTADEAVTHQKLLVDLPSLVHAPDKTDNCRDETLTLHGLLPMLCCVHIFRRVTHDFQARQLQRHIVDSNDDTLQRKR